ncbi:MAG: chemotaxis protein CheW [Deltaproteobacteria bacterium]|nr:chemotaxis protein CheW [Deltaproteobacteria bacterium]
MSSATDATEMTGGARQSRDDRWLVVETAGFQFAIPMEILDAVVEIQSSRIKRSQGRRRPGYLGIVEWAGDERELRSLAEQVGLQSRVAEAYPTLVTTIEGVGAGGGTGEPYFWAVERVVASVENGSVQVEPAPARWWAGGETVFTGLWWHGGAPVWVVDLARVVRRAGGGESAA